MLGSMRSVTIPAGPAATLALYCYRHGESAANAGQVTASPEAIALTPRGCDQAERIARCLFRRPDLIVVSPFQRARDTAAPTLARFAGMPHEVWPIQEFTYLAPARCVDTSAAQRRGWVDAYWAKADPQQVDGDGAESFSAFIARVAAARQRLQALHADGLREVLLFGHGQFIQALRLMLADTGDRRLTDMKLFRRFDTQSAIAHATPLPAHFDGQVWRTA